MGPEIIVGIDVGMTCTGVCYAVTDQTSQFYIIQRWPGSAGASADKVPTVVCYRKGRFSSWGFETRQEDFNDASIDVAEWFKVHLDKEQWRTHNAGDVSWPRSYKDVQRAYRDFLEQLYGCIKQELESAVIRGVPWSKACIEFIFSVPTTWTAISITQAFESLIREAGFGRDGAGHKVTIGLTEAEAAAIHTFATETATYRDGDIILVVDAGGGTTDLALLRASTYPDSSLRLKQLDTVHGLELGSVEIDVAFEELAEQRLNAVAQELNLSEYACERAARRMARESFKPHKENFGSDMSNRQVRKKIDIPGISDDITIESAGIRGGGLIITNDDIKALFDTQLRRMFQLIDLQMSKMPSVAPGGQITHMVMSGGLGSSEYIRKALTERYIHDRATVHPNALQMQIVRSRHPQAAPVQGLLHDRLSKRETGQAVLVTRKSRIALGVVCHVLYNPKVHTGNDVYVDKNNGCTYTLGQIHWFVHKGDDLTDQSIKHAFCRTLSKREPRAPWTTRIVMSHASGVLPRSLKDKGVHELCRMKSDLTGIALSQFQKHKTPWYACGRMPTWYSAEYEIRFVIGAAVNVEAELWFKDRKYNEPSGFTIDWDEGVSASAPQELPGEGGENYHRWKRGSAN